MPLLEICLVGNCDHPVLVLETSTIPRVGEMLEICGDKTLVLGSVTRIHYKHTVGSPSVTIRVIIDGKKIR